MPESLEWAVSFQNFRDHPKTSKFNPFWKDNQKYIIKIYECLPNSSEE